MSRKKPGALRALRPLATRDYRLLFAAAQALQGQLVKTQAQPQAHGCLARQGPVIVGANIPIIELILYINTVLIL